METIDISKMNVQDKLNLVEKIYSSIDKNEFEISKAVKIELDRRLERLKNNEMKFFTIEQLKERLNYTK